MIVATTFILHLASLWLYGAVEAGGAHADHRTDRLSDGGGRYRRSPDRPVPLCKCVGDHLGPGTYEIGALWLDGADNNTFPGDVATVNTVPALTFIQDGYVSGGTLADPINRSGSNEAYFGPNFLVSNTRTMTPEPGTLVLLGSGLLGAVGVIRRKFNL
jgi:hypothetical protein